MREEERKRISREIHDELGQILTALRMDVSLARLSYGESNPQLMERLQSVTHLVDRTINIARNITSSLRLGALDLGIVAALEWLTEDFTRHTNIPCELKMDNGNIILSEFAATQVKIIVTQTESQHCFEVRDNGKGIDLYSVSRKKSFGLIGIRERVAILEGDLVIDSELSRGTSVLVNVPVA